jgi:hypothetical protein
LRETLKDVKIKLIKNKVYVLNINSRMEIEENHNTIIEKTCSKCKLIKTIDSFTKDKTKKDGVRSQCKNCVSIYSKQFCLENKEKIKQRKAEYRSNPEVKEKEKQKYKEYYHRPEVKQRYEEYRNKPEIKERHKEYLNQPEVKEKEKLRLKQNSTKRKEVLKERYKNDENFQLVSIIRSRLSKALKRNKNKSSIEYLGCDIEFLKKWLEFRFDENMNWDNLGSYWHIDHILPINRFNLINDNDKMICFHWTNLQPLTSTENLQKKDKLLLHYYFNNIVNVTRFNSQNNQFLGYQIVNESLRWLRLELRYGKNPSYDNTEKVFEIDNPQPSL